MGKQTAAAVTGNAARVAAHRERHARLDVSLPIRVDKTIEQLASENSTIKSAVVRMLIRYALTNRDWVSHGLIWRD